MLTAEAAVHSGAGKVTLCVPEIIKRAVQGRIIPEVMVTSINENHSIYEGRQVVAIGPGFNLLINQAKYLHFLLFYSSPIPYPCKPEPFALDWLYEAY